MKPKSFWLLRIFCNPAHAAHPRSGEPGVGALRDIAVDRGSTGALVNTGLPGPAAHPPPLHSPGFEERVNV
jgi:hypothetical protein